MAGGITPPISRILGDQFSAINGQGCTKQVALEGVGFGEKDVLFPAGWPVRAGKVGIGIFSGVVEVTNIKVTDWEGNQLLFDDFAGDTVGTFPSARWGQYEEGTADFKVREDLTAPSAAHKVLKQEAEGAIWAWLYGLTDVIPVDNKFILEADFCAISGAAGLSSLAWYLTKDESGLAGYYVWEECFSTSSVLRRRDAAGTNTDILGHTRDAARQIAKWYHMKVVIDNCNCRWYSDDDNGKLLFRYHSVASDRAILLDTVLEDGEGPGSLEGMWSAAGGAYDDPTLLLYIDDYDTPALTVPMRLFMYSGLTPGAAYSTRLQGSDLPGRSQWRRFHVPYTRGARVELRNNFAGMAVLYQQTWWRKGRPPQAYRHYEPVYDEQVVASTAWATLAEVSGAGVLSGLYVDESCGVETFLEGDLRITVDGEVVWLASGTEDVPFASYYFTGGVQHNDYAGVIEHTEGPPITAAWYRRFWPDPIIFKESLKVEIQNGQGNQSPPGEDLTIRSLCEIYTK